MTASFNTLFGKKELSTRGTEVKQFVSDWRASDAHLYLLSRFLKAQQVEHLIQPYIKEILGEEPEKAIQRFIVKGVLEPSALPDKLLAACTATQLKAMAKDRGLMTSGTKGSLVGRLLSSDPGEMEKVVAHLNILECSTDGRKHAEAYVAKIRAARSASLAASLNMLRAHDFRRASLAMTSFEATQPIKRGIGVDWANPDIEAYANQLEKIFISKPGILKGLKDSEWEPLRVATGMLLLWGVGRCLEWLPDGFVGVDRFDGEVAARMLLFFTYTQRDIESFHKGRFKKVRVVGCGEGSCPACKQIGNKVYSLATIPELPHPDCISESGCRCNLIGEEQ